MKFNLRYLAAMPKEIIGNYEHKFTMRTIFYVRKNGEIKMFFGDTIKSDDNLQILDMNDSAYPNQGEKLLTRQDLWLSMFFSHIDDASQFEDESEL